MQKARVMEVLNDAFFRNRHEDERYRKGWCDAFITVENALSEAFREEIAAQEPQKGASPVGNETMTTQTAMKHDPVNHPSHYTCGRRFEVIEVLEDWRLPFHLANSVKYIARAGRKDPTKTVEDLQKAVWYLNRYIGWLKREGLA